MTSIQSIAVIGSGLMGRGIAYASAVGGFRTLVHDVSKDALDRAFVRIRADLDERVGRGKLSAEAADAAYGRLTAQADLGAAAAAADFVIEAIPEDMDLKVRTFALLDARCRPDVVL